MNFEISKESRTIGFCRLEIGLQSSLLNRFRLYTYIGEHDFCNLSKTLSSSFFRPLRSHNDKIGKCKKTVSPSLQ